MQTTLGKSTFTSKWGCCRSWCCCWWERLPNYGYQAAAGSCGLMRISTLKPPFSKRWGPFINRKQSLAERRSVDLPSGSHRSIICPGWRNVFSTIILCKPAIAAPSHGTFGQILLSGRT
ncbi:mas-related G-protein coupled receptor member X1-like protein [Anopheles sinensis]|uniref:Mas-related G-protein coupled receptor member X1-like protein n=1 Tax=Anopheles sinensis TaxID=74873 RepID=A0A084WEI4_ANOSI|nr:mas-related G-protein coupled receptor member X1-like protein [Anopheles sinensis]